MSCLSTNTPNIKTLTMEREVPILLEQNRAQVLLQRLRTAEEHLQRLIRDSLQDIPEVRPSCGKPQRHSLQQRERVGLQVFALRAGLLRALRRQFDGVGLLGELRSELRVASEGAEEEKRAERRLLAAREHNAHRLQVLHAGHHADYRDLHAAIGLLRALQRVQKVQNVRRYRGEAHAAAHEQHVLPVRLRHAVGVARARNGIRFLQQVQRREGHRNTLIRHHAVVLHAERALQQHFPLRSREIVPRHHAPFPQIRRARLRLRPNGASRRRSLRRSAALASLRVVRRELEEVCEVLHALPGRTVRQSRETTRPGIAPADHADVEEQVVLQAVRHRQRVELHSGERGDAEIDHSADEPADGTPREKTVAQRHVENDQIVVDFDPRDARLASEQRERAHAEVGQVESQREAGEELEPRGMEEKEGDEGGNEELVGDIEELPEAVMHGGERGEGEEEEDGEAPEEDLGGLDEAEAG